MVELALPGCTPEPLMSYLKALGVFRLVSEQADVNAKLSWRGGHAVLHSTLDRDALLAFFMDRFKPTPILAPWNGGSGFMDEHGADSILSVIRTSGTPRLEHFRQAVKATDKCIHPLANVRRKLKSLELQKKELKKAKKEIPNSLDEHIGKAKREQEERKSRLQIELRQSWPDELLSWFDAVAVFDEQGDANYFPLLGTGGNDGRLDFTNNFMQRLAEVMAFVEGESAPESSHNWLAASLFADTLVELGKSAIGQFNPGGIGGANAVQGKFEADSRVNPWDYVLMLEGAVFFAGSVSRRWNTGGSAKAAFPFTVDSIAVGYGSATAGEETTDGSRAELWMPLWDNPIAFAAVKHLFAEGRAQFGRRQARNSVEFALAVNVLGIDRGLSSFSRYGFLKRNGLAFLAAPLGRLTVTPRPAANLLADPELIVWLDRLRRACSDKDKTPARYQSVLRGIDRAIYTFANRSEQGGDEKALNAILRAFGAAERTLALEGLSWVKDKQYGWKLSPLNGFKSDWLIRAFDDSPEFRLAESLAGIHRTDKVPPLRAYLEPVRVTNFASWEPESRSAVWSRRSLVENLAAVFRRRQLEAFRSGDEGGVPLKSSRPARLDDVLAFLRVEVDDDKLNDLLWGLLGIKWSRVDRLISESIKTEIPFDFGVLRLLVQSRQYKSIHRKLRNPKPGQSSTRLAWHHDSTSTSQANAKHDPDVFHILRTPDSVADAVTKAARRLKSGGLLVNGYRNRRQAGRALDVPSSTDPTRLLAAMLFPLAERDLDRIANAVLYPPEVEV